MNALASSYLSFLIWLILSTMVVGMLGMLLPQLFSLMILLPYIIAFVHMALRFVKKFQLLPTTKQRWQLSIGCASIFLLYSCLAGGLGLILSQDGDINALYQVLGNTHFVIFFVGLYLCINAILVMLGYWFLGKPTAKMLAYYQQHGS